MKLNVGKAKMAGNMSKASLIVLLLTMLGGCSMFHGDEAQPVVDKSDPQYLELKAMLEEQKIEWATHKPALERMVKNEEDLTFLIDALSKMSVIGSAPSLEQYMQDQPQYAQGERGVEDNSAQGSALSVNNSTINANSTTNATTSINVNSGNTRYANPLAPLADSPAELTQLMSDLQKLARTVRYNQMHKREAGGAPDNEAAQTPLGIVSTRYAALGSGIFANSKVQLADYAQQLAGKLAKFSALDGATVGVASFVEFDNTLKNSSSLGNQFAEALATELPRYGVTVVDFKLTKRIDVSPMGDLALSRDSQELQGQREMEYVLTGTLVATHRGVKINSRVVSVNDNGVIAAASTFVPKMVLQQLQP